MRNVARHAFQGNILGEDDARNIGGITRPAPGDLFELDIVPYVNIVASMEIRIHIIGTLQ